MRNLTPIYIFIATILALALARRLDAFSPGPTKVVMLGDSILKNNAYVAETESVEYLLKARLAKGAELSFLAQDEALIADIEAQVAKIDQGAQVFISIGGNDILKQIQGGTISQSTLTQTFDEYKACIQRILENHKPHSLHLINLYFPTSPFITPYHTYIRQWNSLLTNFTKTNPILRLFELDTLCSEPPDFVSIVEPSPICSKKIVDKIYSLL